MNYLLLAVDKVLQTHTQWHRKLFRTRVGAISGNWEGYQDTFVWRKITFLLSDSINLGAPAP